MPWEGRRVQFSTCARNSPKINESSCYSIAFQKQTHIIRKSQIDQVNQSPKMHPSTSSSLYWLLAVHPHNRANCSRVLRVPLTTTKVNHAVIHLFHLLQIAETTTTVRNIRLPRCWLWKNLARNRNTDWRNPNGVDPDERTDYIRSPNPRPPNQITQYCRSW